MRPLLSAFLLSLLLLGVLCQEEQLRAVDSATGVDVTMVSSKPRENTAKASGHSSFEQMMNYAYKRTSYKRAAAGEFPTTPEAEGKCLEFADDLCHAHDGDCAGCLTVQGCGYCNDARQCLRSDGDNPGIEGCHCEVWMNEPKQCIEDVCAVVTGCDECSKKPYCVWCPHERLCMPGGFFGLSSGKTTECKDWRWLRCTGLTGKNVLIIAGSTTMGVLLLFFATCIVYHKCYSPVKHSAHMHDELVESLLEDERNILSGQDPNEPELDPALDLKGDSAALNDPQYSLNADEPVTLDDDMSQSEAEEDQMDVGES